MVRTAVAGLLLLAAFAWGLYLTFTNPDMTRTRLFLNYWHHQLGMLALLALAIGILPKDRWK